MRVYHYGAVVQAPWLAPASKHEDLAPFCSIKANRPSFTQHDASYLRLDGSRAALMLLIDLLSSPWGARVRRTAPLLFFVGGIFLLVFSDQDAWPLYHVRPFRPITDKEVLMHKIYAVLMLAMGLQGLIKRKQPAKLSKEMQSRLMAVFALVGGALLFTHVHSNAPYANVAAGVYIHHTVMGFVALLIGAVKLLEEHQFRQQKERALLPTSTWLARGLAGAYPCLMALEALILINYNEGLPWFLGYAHLSRVAPHHGLIAPLASNRAELTFNPSTQQLALYLYKQINNGP